MGTKMSDESNDTREEHWANHPIVKAGAKIPTQPILRSYALIKKGARRGRRSIAFYARPLRGKTTSIAVMKALIQRDFPGSGVFVYRVASKDGIDKLKEDRPAKFVISRGGFHEALLSALGDDIMMASSVEGKANQFYRALYARSVNTRRLFIFIDEAQALVASEFGWLKDVINYLVDADIFVTTILFGQEKLREQFEKLRAHLRDDLIERFLRNIYEFEGIANVEELRLFLAACDTGSEFPHGSGMSYTRFLWPKAFANGFRLANCAQDFWEALVDRLMLTNNSNGIGMNVVAEALAELADMTKDMDGTGLIFEKKLWISAIQRSH